MVEEEGPLLELPPVEGRDWLPHPRGRLHPIEAPLVTCDIACTDADNDYDDVDDYSCC